MKSSPSNYILQKMTEREPKKFPPIKEGVLPNVHNFLTDAFNEGTYSDIDARWQNFIALYFGTDYTSSDIALTYGISQSRVRGILYDALERLWSKSSKETQNKYVLEDIRRLKQGQTSEMKAKFSRARRGKPGNRNIVITKETKQKLKDAANRNWQNEKYQEKAAKGRERARAEGRGWFEGAEHTVEARTKMVEFHQSSDRVKNRIPRDSKFIQPGVSETTHDFLWEAFQNGLFDDKIIPTRSRNIMAIYFGTQASSSDLARAYGVSKEMIKSILRRGLKVLWKKAPEYIRIKYVEEEIRLKRGHSPRSIDKFSMSRKRTIPAKKEAPRKKPKKSVRVKKESDKEAAISNVLILRLRLNPFLTREEIANDKKLDQLLESGKVRIAKSGDKERFYVPSAS